MSKKTAQIPVGEIARVDLYVGRCKKTLAQVKRETGADYVLNGGMWNPDGSACPLLKVDGRMLSKTPWTAEGYGWDGGPDIRLTADYGGVRNFITCTPLIGSGGPIAKPSYGSAQGGRRGRSAIALTADKLVLYCSTDGSGDARTPEQLRDELAAMGCRSAVMLDSGGSSQCDFNGQKITSSRKVHNLILVYRKQGGREPPEKEAINVGDLNITKKYTTRNPCYTANIKCKKTKAMLHSTATPGADAGAIMAAWDKPGAGAGVEFVIDPTGVYQCLPLGIKSGHAAGSANSTHVACEICEPEETVFLPINWRPLSQGGRYNRAYAVKRLQQELMALGFDPKGVDGSFGPGCAAAVKAYQRSVGLTADGSVGPATLNYLQKREGSYLRYNRALAEDSFARVYGYAVKLFAWLMGEIGGKAGEIVCHSEGFKLGIASNHADVLHWFPQHGKSMDTFRADVAAAMAGALVPGDPLGEAVDKLAAKGILTAPDYWKGGNYSAANVQALIVKMAAAL